MIGYVTLGTNNVKRAASFHDALLAELGAKRMTENESLVALALGGSDEGAPGPRGEGFYAGYFRDLDGNKLNVFHAGCAAARGATPRRVAPHAAATVSTGGAGPAAP